MWVHRVGPTILCCTLYHWTCRHKKRQKNRDLQRTAAKKTVAVVKYGGLVTQYKKFVLKNVKFHRIIKFHKIPERYITSKVPRTNVTYTVHCNFHHLRTQSTCWAKWRWWDILDHDWTEYIHACRQHLDMLLHQGVISAYENYHAHCCGVERLNCILFFFKWIILEWIEQRSHHYSWNVPYISVA